MYSTGCLNNRVRGCWIILIAFVFFLPYAAQLDAQTDTARIQGSVADIQGAAIAGASITVSNLETGAASSTVSDVNGNFTVSALPRGSYKAQTQQTGFAAQEQRFSLDISQVRVLQFRLAPGSATTTVTVSDTAPLIDLATSSTGEVIKGSQVTELPLNGRNFTQLALLAPGVTRGNAADSGNGQGGNVETFRYNQSGGAALSVNGLRPQANNFILDGVDNNESLVNTIVFFTPIDATDEFRVTTSVAPAEFGRAGGAIIESSIKSGTNSIHGSAFDFLRNAVFDSNPNYQFLGAKHIPSALFQQNQFGGSAGLPILKNKLFIFGDYQGLRRKEGLNPSFQTVPTVLMRQGNFSELLSYAQAHPGHSLTAVPGCAGNAANTGAIYDPVTCAPFPGNVIPNGRLNAAAVNYLNAFSAPTNPDLIQGNYVTVQKQVSLYNDFDVRLDLNLNQSNHFFARYSYGQDNFNKTSLFSTLPAGFATGSNVNHPRGAAAGYTHIFTPNLLNEFRYGYSRSYFAYVPPFFGDNLSARLGIVNANRNALTSGGALIGDNNSQLSYTGDGGLYSVPEHTHQFLDTVSWNQGAHAFKFGVNIIHREVAFFAGNLSKGFFNFVNQYSGDPNWTGYDISEALAGFSNYSLGNSQNYFDTINWETGYFAQDDWRLTKRLTVNLGLRYDLYTFPYTDNNQQSNFDIYSGQLLVAGKDGQSKSQVATNYNNIAPRIGFAYDLYGNGRSVLRGGYGIFYFQDRGGVGNQLSNNPDFNGAASYAAGSGYRVTFSGQGPAYDNNNLHATAALPPPTNVVDAKNPKNVNVIAQLPHNQTPMIQQWNLQMQQQLGQATAVTLAYVGTKADHLTNVYNLNAQPLDAPNGFRLFPGIGYGSVVVNANTGISSYHGLQAHLEHRFSQGLTTTASYTWSHTIDNSIAPLGNESNYIFIDPANKTPILKWNRGNSFQDQRQGFTFSNLYDLPFGKGRRFGTYLPRLLDYAVGGWQTNLIASLFTGTPFEVYDSLFIPTNYLDVISSYRTTGSVTHPYFTTDSFVRAPYATSGPQAGVYSRPGDFGRNRLHGPGVKDVDFAIVKRFPVVERVNAEFRGEAFNVFNTPQFGNPDGNFNDQNFGLISSTRANSSRQLQLALRFTF